MRRNVLLVEPKYRSSYPPLGLMKLSTYHRLQGDEVRFVRGFDAEAASSYWDRIYISSLFSYDWSTIADTVHRYRDNLFGAASGKIIVGGVAASLMPEELYSETGVFPHVGRVLEAGAFGDQTDLIVDSLVPDYSILEQVSYKYRYGRSFLGHTTRGCIRTCRFCAVPTLEPSFEEYVDIRPIVEGIREQIGDQPDLVLMDNNVLASPRLEKILDDLVELGFARGARLDKRARTVDDNQGLDARLITKEIAAQLARIPLKPVRIAYDSLRDRPVFTRAVRLVTEVGFREVSNYLLYNYEDEPKDLWQRMHHCVELSEELGIQLWSFPMRYIPVTATKRGYVGKHWNPRLLRGMQCVSLVTRGAISHRHDFFHRAFGETAEEFVEILSMPDRYIIERGKYENDGADNWRSIYRGMSEVEREELMRTVSGATRGQILESLEQLPEGRIREAVAHYVGVE